ncbi:O-antigen ligase family protein [Bradyrhizobium sp. 160]|uniref:O-antigen ligase family protein n=1 Tax=Bradyrhizobium sp. 160 TaxID=2782634 RepID=UPI001FFA0539|nr:O-antigen ligase family protein [Bradyrhizobium sp. 160]MCK1625453.1 O-antigen ligase family protein [Bradyrhizobium sp. 160]
MQITYIADNESRTRLDARLCFATGAIDGLTFLSYLFGIEQSIYYSGTILLKIALLFIRRKNFTNAAHASLPFIYVLTFAEIASAIVNEVELISTVRILVFCINLFVTLNFVGTNYWRGLVLVSLIDAATYFIFVRSGNIGIVFGRYLFFSQSHPNLGAEIFFGGAFAALLTKTPRISLLTAPIFFVPTFLMQGRAAEIGIALAAGILGWQVLGRWGHHTRVLLIALSSCAMLVVLANLDLSDIINKVLLLDDVHRGEGSGASGRGRYWATAVTLWVENPLFGAGSDYVARLGLLQPHNFFLYPLAYYGFLGAVVLIVFMQPLVTVLLSGAPAIYLLPLLPMLAFNDRFVNLNVYPAVLFLHVFHQYAKLRSSDNAGTSRAVATPSASVKVRRSS